MSLAAWWAVQNHCLTWLRSQFCRVQYFPLFYRLIEVSRISFRWWLLRTFFIASWTLRKYFRSCAKSSGFFLRRRRKEEWEWLQNFGEQDGCRLRCTSLNSIGGALFQIERASLSTIIQDVQLRIKIKSTYIFELLVLFCQVVVEVEELLVGQFLFQVSVMAHGDQMSIGTGWEVASAHLNWIRNHFIYYRLTFYRHNNI